MRTILKNRRFRLTMAVFLCFFGVVVWAAWYFRVYSWRDLLAVNAMSQECHPAWREFHFRRVGPGSRLADVIRDTNPVSVKTFGDFTILAYQGGGLHMTGMGATAYKGRIVEAGAASCCWSITWFDIRSAEEKDLFNKEYENVMRPIRERWEREEAEERAKQPEPVPPDIEEP